MYGPGPTVAPPPHLAAALLFPLCATILTPLWLFNLLSALEEAGWGALAPLRLPALIQNLMALDYLAMMWWRLWM